MYLGHRIDPSRPRDVIGQVIIFFRGMWFPIGGLLTFYPNWKLVPLPRYLVETVLSLLCQSRPAFSLCKRP